MASQAAWIAVDTALYQTNCYRDAQRVRNDVATLIMRVPSLVPRPGKLAPTSPVILALVGTIPIAYKGTAYNIPVNIWIVETYPFSPPLCKVTPTPDMIIKARHKHVDSTGTCYLPYLSDWTTTKTPSLVGLVGELAKILAEDPPVRAKPKDGTPIPSSSSTISTSSSSSSSTPISPRGFPPQLPHRTHMLADKSFSTGALPTPLPFPSVSSSSSPSPSPSASPLSLSATSSSSSKKSKKKDKKDKNTKKGKSHHRTRERQGSDPSMISPRFAGPTAYSSAPPASQRVDPVTADYAKRELLTKIQQRVRALDASLALANEKAALDAEFEELTRKLDDVTNWLSVNDRLDGADVDTVSDPPDPLARQLLRLVAEDASYDDALFVVDKALTQEAFDCTTYLKTVRKIAHQQFLARALLRKVEAARRGA